MKALRRCAVDKVTHTRVCVACRGEGGTHRDDFRRGGILWVRRVNGLPFDLQTGGRAPGGGRRAAVSETPPP